MYSISCVGRSLVWINSVGEGGGGNIIAIVEARVVARITARGQEPQSRRFWCRHGVSEGVEYWTGPGSEMRMYVL